MTAEQALTHHVALVLDNDEPLYRHQLDLTQRALTGNPAAHAVGILADSLKDFCEYLVFGEGEDVTHSLATELLNTALAHVDWRSLAAGYIDDALDS